MAGLVLDVKQLEHGLVARDRARTNGSRLHGVWLSAVGGAVLLLILALIATIAIKGSGRIDWEFLSNPPVEGMSAGGIWPMIRGSLLLMVGTLALTLPIGILGGVFLAEYAGHSKWVNLVKSAITSLAGTPSIIYGLFGFAVFVLMFKFGVSLMAGWLTLTIMSLPIVVLTTDEAIRAVPDSQVEGALALGMTRWQSMVRVVMPNAMPGIMTGLVLAVSRAAGEAPPILLTAGIYYSTVTPGLSWETLKQPVANLPYHLAEAYRQSSVIPEDIVWGTCLVLMSFVLFVNLGAILVRANMRRRKQQ
jgi:phosphate transport system permease protein